MKYDERPDTYASKGWHSYMRLRESEKRVKEFETGHMKPGLTEGNVDEETAESSSRIGSCGWHRCGGEYFSCPSHAHGFIDSQVQYRNVYGAANVLFTRGIRYSVYTGSLPGYTLYDLSVTEYRNGVYVDNDSFGFLPPSGTSTNTSISLDSMSAFPGVETKVVYVIKYKNGAGTIRSCQGQMNIGM